MQLYTLRWLRMLGLLDIQCLKESIQKSAQHAGGAKLTKIHNVISADSTVVDNDIPSP